MKSFAVVTGGGSGVGRALAINLAKDNNLQVLIVGRTLETLNKTKKLADNKIQIVQADIATELGRAAILEVIPKDARIKYLIHNAAVIEASELKDIQLKDWRYQVEVNLEAPLFLTQTFLPYLTNGPILNISSGFARIPAHGIAPYCITKAGLYMLYQCLSLELEQFNIKIGSLGPGVVDTPFQDKIRTFSAKTFPALPKFQALKENNKMNSPEKVAKFITWVLSATDDKQFSEKEWSIADEWHHKEWA
ncbi:MAG: SDR family NAD(P)-dependent oxidoreductase [Legionellales bacterium]|nr:SDR family NAD(P)-dependent oxidoreductase [Legionellales bacterium]